MSFSSGAIQVTASASKIITADDQAHVSVVLYNNGPNAVAIGFDNTVTTANGFLIPAGGSLTLDHSRSAQTDIWAICSVLQVSPADTRYVMEG